MIIARKNGNDILVRKIIEKAYKERVHDKEYAENKVLHKSSTKINHCENF